MAAGKNRSEAQVQALCEIYERYVKNKIIAEDVDFEVYIADYNHLGVYVCRILIPSMSDIYTVEDLLWSK